MTTMYVVEYYDEHSQRYRVIWEGESLDTARIVFNKAYNRKLTRRLVSTTVSVVESKQGEQEDKE